MAHWKAAQTAWQHPFARFLVYHWSEQQDLERALRRVIHRGGLHGCAFLASLVVDGVDLGPRLTSVAIDHLRKLSRPRRELPQRRAAIDVATTLDPTAAMDLLAGLATGRAVPVADRRWAVIRLATLLEPRTALNESLRTRPERSGAPRWAISVLAQHPGRTGTEVLARLARDRTVEAADRRWAAEALHHEGEARATELLVRIAEDERVDKEERRWAAQTATAALEGQPGRRVRARIARFNAPWQGTQITEVLEPLLAIHRASHPKADARQLQFAFDVAARWHSGQYRKSGDPYITHPLAVATILANLGMDTITLVAALLHDTIEDTAYSLEQVRADFGAEVALLVDGVAKLDRVKLGDAAKAENVRKMVVATAKDPRVLVIKLADRLHNMRTLTFLPRAKQEDIAAVTIDVYAPLARRLGINIIRWELEDLSFGTLFPKRFEEINRLIGEHQPQREALLRPVLNQVQIVLRSGKIKAEVISQPKHLYSIYQKMSEQDRDVNDIYDLVGVRILVDTVRDCYAALGMIHANWQPVRNGFKDYIAMPKFNMYQSLHTTVIGPTGKPVEMQIRTFAMHRTAEFGIAAHWRYKEQKGATIVGPPAHIDEMTWLRQLLDWQREASDPSEFLDALRFDLSSQKVYVFTPKGDVIPLPTDSTPVDFAYAVHTEVGHKCIGARVNGKLVPLESTLSAGDAIEIVMSKTATAGPTQDWLGFVKSPRARTKIRQFFNKERREEAIEVGKESIVKAMRKQGLPLQRMLTSENLTTIARDLHLPDVASLYAAVGESTVSAQSVVQKLVAGFADEEGTVEDIAETAVATRPPRNRSTAQDPGVVVKGVSDVWVKLARCCTPVPGDTVFGFVTRSSAVSVHREDCANAQRLREHNDRVVDVNWTSSAVRGPVRVGVQIEALDRRFLLADIAAAFADQQVTLVLCTASVAAGHLAYCQCMLEASSPDVLQAALVAVHDLDGVYDITRGSSRDSSTCWPDRLSLPRLVLKESSVGLPRPRSAPECSPAVAVTPLRTTSSDVSPA